MLATLRDDVTSLQQVVVSQTASTQGLMIAVERSQDMLTQLVRSDSAPAVLSAAVVDDAQPVSRLTPPPARAQPVADPRLERLADPASAVQRADLPVNTLRAAGLSAERSLFTATPPTPLPFVQGISPRNALSSLDTFYGSSNKSCEMPDIKEFLPVQLPVQSWFEGSAFKLTTAGVYVEAQTLLLCQKLSGAALAAFGSAPLGRAVGGLSVCSLADLRLVDLFPNAEATLTRKLASITFRAKSMILDLVKSVTSLSTRVLAMLDANDYVYSLVRAKTNTAKPNCLLAVQNEPGLSLDKSLPFHDYSDVSLIWCWLIRFPL